MIDYENIDNVAIARIDAQQIGTSLFDNFSFVSATTPINEIAVIIAKKIVIPSSPIYQLFFVLQPVHADRQLKLAYA